jgi:hypothetical protein
MAELDRTAAHFELQTITKLPEFFWYECPEGPLSLVPCMATTAMNPSSPEEFAGVAHQLSEPGSLYSEIVGGACILVWI